MANKHSFAIGPWTMKRTELKDFIAVTEFNRKNIIVIGRILYVISTKSPITYNGFFIIHPCMNKGWWKVPLPPFIGSEEKTHSSVFIDEDMNNTVWAVSHKNLIDKHIKNEELFIKKSDPILKFER